MTTSDESWSTKLRKIGDYERGDHNRLSEEDECAYFGEYTPTGSSGKPAWSLSKANQILANLKKDPSTKGTAQWRYKVGAISYLGRLIFANLSKDHLQRLTVVPVPPSTAGDDPSHDLRMLRVAEAIGNGVDARPILETIITRGKASQSEEGRSADALKENMRIDEDQVSRQPVSQEFIVLDDMLTTGSTFVACRDILIERFGDIQVYGLFIVRRVPLNPFEGLGPDEFDIDLSDL